MFGFHDNINAGSNAWQGGGARSYESATQQDIINFVTSVGYDFPGGAPGTLAGQGGANYQDYSIYGALGGSPQGMWFTETFGDFYSGTEWDSTEMGTSYKDVMTGKGDLAALQEKGLWDAFTTWQQGQLSVLGTSFENLDIGYQEQLDDIESRKEMEIMGAKAGLDESLASASLELKKEKRRAGRTGFGAGKDFARLMKSTKERLLGKSAGVSDAEERAIANIEKLDTRTATNVENQMLGYYQGAQSQLANIGQQLATIQTTFKNEAEGVYMDWATGISDITSDIMTEQQGALGSEEGWWEYEGWTGGGDAPAEGDEYYMWGFDEEGNPIEHNYGNPGNYMNWIGGGEGWSEDWIFDPWQVNEDASDSNVDTYLDTQGWTHCPPGYTWNSNTGACE